MHKGRAQLKRTSLQEINILTMPDSSRTVNELTHTPIKYYNSSNIFSCRMIRYSRGLQTGVREGYEGSRKNVILPIL
jgi:hypothetical protein